MPEIFRAYGYSFLFFSHEHEPVHIHAVGQNGAAKYVWNGSEFEFYEQHGINRRFEENQKDDRRE